MHVGGAAVDRAQDQRIHQAHHGRVGRQRLQAEVDLGLVVRHELKAESLAGLLQEELATAVALQQLGHAPRRRHHRLDGPAEMELRLVHAREVVEAAEGQHQPSVLAPDGHAPEAHEKLERRLRPQRRVVGRAVEGVEGKLETAGLTPCLLGVGFAGRGR